MSPARMRGLATRMGFGDMARRYYHRPISDLRRLVREGGPVAQRRTELGRLQMIEAAAHLPPLPNRAAPPLEVSFLSGANYWPQTLFCIYSLQLQTPLTVAPVIYDDGSLDRQIAAVLTRVAPACRFVFQDAIEARLDAVLPAARFPALRRRRLDYPHLRKLTDLHAGRGAWTAVFDSDMLFFRPPSALLAWLQAPDRPCHLTDVAPAYGYSDALMRELAEGPVPPLVNVGVCGLHSGEIDWDRLEFWCRTLLEREGASYLQEQALSALLLSRGPALRLDTPDYLVRPTLAEGREPTAALHHYVAESKRSYFQHGWRRIAASALELAGTGAAS